MPIPPINRGDMFNAAALAATNLLAASIAPTDLTSRPVTALRVTVSIKPGATTSVFHRQVNSGGVAILEAFNGGTALTVGALYTFVCGISAARTYNFQMATGTTIGSLLVEEIQDGVL